MGLYFFHTLFTDKVQVFPRCSGSSPEGTWPWHETCPTVHMTATRGGDMPLMSLGWWDSLEKKDGG